MDVGNLAALFGMILAVVGLLLFAEGYVIFGAACIFVVLVIALAGFYLTIT